jgi:hypothetical protein
MRVWAVAAVIVGVVAWAGIVLTISDDRNHEAQIADSDRYQIDRLDRLPRPGARSSPIVIVLGNSLVWAALQRDGILGNEPPVPVNLLVLTADFQRGNWFETLLPALRRLHPDLLLVDSDLLRVPDLRRPLAKRLRHLLDLMWQRSPPATLAPECRGLGVVEAITPKVTAGYQGGFDPQQMMLSRLPILVALREAGYAVDVLQIPRATDLERAVPNLVAWGEGETALLKSQGIGVWAPPVHLPGAYYCDFSHFNRAGALIFDDWFVGRLKQAFDPAP